MVGKVLAQEKKMKANKMKGEIVAEMKIGSVEALEGQITIIVKLMDSDGKFHVFVDGGCLGDGSDHFSTDYIDTAMARAGKEAADFLKDGE